MDKNAEDVTRQLLMVLGGLEKRGPDGRFRQQPEKDAVHYVAKLISRGADVNAPDSGDSDKKHALHYAADRWGADMVRLLLDHGAKPDARDARDRMAIDFISDNKRLKGKDRELVLKRLKFEPHWFKSIRIENYRGIRSLKINDLAQVNFLFGQNNCGKTTILEAINILGQIHNSGAAVENDNFVRGIIWTLNQDFHNFFHNLDYDNVVNISGLLTNEERRSVRITPRWSAEIAQSTKMDVKGQIITPKGGSDPHGLQFNVKVARPGEESREASPYLILVSQENMPGMPTTVTLPPLIRTENQPSDPVGEDLSTLFTFPGADALGAVIEVIRAGGKDALLKKFSRLFQQQVEDIQIIGQTIYIAIKDADILLPLNFMGRGAISALIFFSCLLQRSHSIILRDEFENGLFHTTLKRMWSTIFAETDNTGKQLFLTFHSIDVLRSLRDFFEEQNIDPNDQKKIALYNIYEKQNGTHDAYKLTPEEAVREMGLGNEIRI